MEIHNLATQISKEKNKFDHWKGAKVSLCDTRGGQITLTLAVQLTNPRILWNMDTFVSARRSCDPDLQWRILALLTAQRHPTKRTRGD